MADTTARGVASKPDSDEDLPDLPKVDEQRSSMSIIRKVVPYLWPADQNWIKVRVVVAIAMLLLAKVASVSTPFFYKGAVDALAPENPGTGFLLITSAVGLTIAYGMMRLLSVGFNQLRDAVFARVAQRALRQLALETFQHMHALSLRYHITRKTGGLSRIIERGVKGVEFLLRFLLFSMGPLVLELLMIAVILWWVFEDANQKAIDSLLNYETVKYFSAEDREASRYDNSMRGYETAALKTSYSLAFLNFGQSVFITAGLIGVMIMAAMGVQNGSLTVGDFVMVNAYMIQITMPLNFLGSVYREIRQSLVDMGEMFELLEQPAEVTDKPNAPALQVNGGELRFTGVDFAYDPDRQILHDLNLTVPAGQTVAVVGPSGSGKSTIGRLLFRFYDVQNGALTIDGQDVRDINQTSLRSAIGVVPQDTVLFNDTIGYNVAYGKAGATQEDIETAAKAAQIHDFITSLPDGYDTVVGERGLKLSGGEKQRVGIARTLLKNPPILLLDEATSALDTDTERDIQESLKAMGKGRSVVTIAHRLSTVVDADKIVVLVEGQVEEEGTHSELLANDGRYASMWHRQAKEEDAA